MSRTHKDKPWHIRFPEEAEKAKKRRDIDYEWHWLGATPSWWTNLFMNRPLRREAQQWERNAQKSQDIEDLEDLDTPNVSKKPHKYYW